MSNWMQCTTCKAVVQLNATGTCLGCQGGFNPQNTEDRYLPVETSIKNNKPKLARLKDGQKELENALKIPSTQSMDACKQASDGKKVGERNAERKETPFKSKEKKWWKKQKEEMKNEQIKENV